jgi:mycothiol synthase
METRNLTENDLPALLDLCQRALPHDEFTLPLLRRRIFGDPEFAPQLQIAAFEGERLAGAMLGLRRAHDEGYGGALNLFAVDPPFRRQGLATRLLRELEERLRAEGAGSLVVGGAAPNYLWPGLDLRYTPAYCLLERNGYSVTGNNAVNMLVELPTRDWDTSAEEARLAADGFEIRRLEERDREAFSAYLTANWSRWWHDEGMNGYENNPVSVHIALRDGQICAFAAYNVEAFDGGFGPTGTDESLRGKGIGRVLFHRCMRDLQQQGLAACEVCWTGPISFYARVADAWIHRSFYRMAKDLQGS